jgi:hypothetical protein
LIDTDDETGSRNDELILRNKPNDKRNQLMGRGGSSSSFSSRFGRHSGIGVDDVDYSGVDQIDKLNNWGEFQRVLDDIKERKAQHRVQARQARAAKKRIE